ncbi:MULTISPECIES: hypothetical protein [unclassified Streptomyces]|uniref:hypothetical protein n=1 Tax=unclassified Streptomyces TaxID=2593676 RepID=UPI0019041FF4|nr:hypothetical protein [Streptomyces sp. HSG2]
MTDYAIVRAATVHGDPVLRETDQGKEVPSPLAVASLGVVVAAITVAAVVGSAGYVVNAADGG